jgi:hypothetical protein
VARQEDKVREPLLDGSGEIALGNKVGDLELERGIDSMKSLFSA